MRKFSLLTAAFLASTSIASAQGLLTLSLDDGFVTGVTNALPIFQKHNIKAVACLATGGIGNDPRYVTWDQAAQFVKAGWEICNHTVDHPYLTKVDDLQLKQEWTEAKEVIEANLGVTPTTCATPYGDYNAKVLEVLKTVCDIHLGAWGSISDNAPEGLNFMMGAKVSRYELNRRIVHRDTPVDEICQEIIYAGKNDLWLILGWHRVEITPDPGTDGEYEVSSDKLDKILTCAQDAQAKGLIHIVGVKEGLSMITQTK